jgi:hypothetical protein
VNASTSAQLIAERGPAHAIIAGMWRFTVVSIAGFAPWIIVDGWFHRHISEVLLYSSCLVAFLAAALVVLPGMVSGPKRLRGVALFFIPAFTLYAVLWCACWFTLGGRLGEWLGLALGGGAFAVITALVLGWPRSAVLSVLAFIIAQALGYVGGGQVMRLLADGHHPGVVGMLGWGVVYGVGFGAGLGYLLYCITLNHETSDLNAHTSAH